MTVRSGAKKGQPLPAPAAEMDYCSRLNRALPPDIRVLGWTDVADDFHARYRLGNVFDTCFVLYSFVCLLIYQVVTTGSQHQQHSSGCRHPTTDDVVQ